MRLGRYRADVLEMPMIVQRESVLIVEQRGRQERPYAVHGTTELIPWPNDFAVCLLIGGRWIVVVCVVFVAEDVSD